MEETKAPAGPTRDDDSNTLDALSVLEKGLQSAGEQGDRIYDSIEEAEIVDRIESDGVWVTMPHFRNIELHICHLRAAMPRAQDLERKHRDRHKILPGVVLDAKVTMALWNDAAFGTAVRGWRGSGIKRPFNLDNFRKMMAIWDFRKDVTELCSERQTFRDAVEAELGKVSGSASGGA